MNGNGPIPKDDLKDKFRRQFIYDADNNNVLFKDESERLFLFNTGQKLVEACHDRMRKVKPSEVETEFRLPVIDSQIGEQAKRDVVGRIDLGITSPLYNLGIRYPDWSDNLPDDEYFALNG